MKTMQTMFGLLVSGLLTGSVALAAEPSAPSVPSNPSESLAPPIDKKAVIEKREQVQEKRIENGVKSGKLTKEEETKLLGSQEKIKKMEEKALSDGKIDSKEAKKITHAQNRASNEIAAKKHNKKTK
jgi:hypothetical protein